MYSLLTPPNGVRFYTLLCLLFILLVTAGAPSHAQNGFVLEEFGMPGGHAPPTISYKVLGAEHMMLGRPGGRDRRLYSVSDGSASGSVPINILNEPGRSFNPLAVDSGVGWLMKTDSLLQIDLTTGASTKLFIPDYIPYDELGGIEVIDSHLMVYRTRKLITPGSNEYALELVGHDLRQGNITVVFSDTITGTLPALPKVYSIAGQAICQRMLTGNGVVTGSVLWTYYPKDGRSEQISGELPFPATLNNLSYTTDDYLAIVVSSSLAESVILTYQAHSDAMSVATINNFPFQILHLRGDTFLVAGRLGTSSVNMSEGIEVMLTEGVPFNDFLTMASLGDGRAIFVHPAGEERVRSAYITDGTPEGTRVMDEFADAGLVFADIEGRAAGVVGFTSNENGERRVNLYDPVRDTLLTITPPVPGNNVLWNIWALGDRFLLFVQSGGEFRWFSLFRGKSGRFTGRVFLDENENGVKESTEKPLANIKVKILETRVTLYSNHKGEFGFSPVAGETYTIVPQPSTCYDVATIDTLVFTAKAASSHVFNVGMGPNGSQGSSIKVGLAVKSNVRCGFVVPLWLTVENDGCTFLDEVDFSLSLPTGAVFESASLEPIMQSDSSAYWRFTEMQPGTRKTFRVLLTAPDENFVGTTLRFGATASGVRGPFMVSDTFTLTETLRCAIDPNDKQVTPHRPEPSNSNYTQLDETLTYTVRFQNTGNDTAFTVRIEDQLSADLDWETFKPVAASHDCKVSLGDDGLATFLFEDILLPDSTTNLVESNGFVTFEIRTKTDLEDFTAIDNTAGIFFDFNDPIITNTVTSTLVEFLDEDMDNFFFWDECDDKNENVFPGSPEIPGNGIDEDCNGSDATVSTQEPLPGRLEVFPNPTRNTLQLRYDQGTELQGELVSLRGRRMQSFVFQRTHQLELSDLPTGVYLLRLTDVRSGAVRVEKVNVLR